MNIDLSKMSALAGAAGEVPPAVPPVVPPVVPVGVLKTFEVKLEGEPAVVVKDCIDRLDAQEKYMKALGINKTERKFTYTEIQ